MSLSIKERREENERLERQLHELESSVKVRESIYRSRVESAGGEVNPVNQVRPGVMCALQNAFFHSQRHCANLSLHLTKFEDGRD